MKKILIAGGNGFLGNAIIDFFENSEYEFIILSRKIFSLNRKNAQVVVWDGETEGEWCKHLEGAFAVINLCGKSVNCRLTDNNKHEILQSRIVTTSLIGNAILKCQQAPQVWMNASSATIYKYSSTKFNTEDDTDFNTDFGTDVALKWEQCFNAFTTPQTRKIALRISIVLGKNDGAFTRLKTLTQFGLGGYQGSGKQYVSWIGELDFCRIIQFLLDSNTSSGAYNICTPQPITNAIFMKTLQHKMKKIVALPTPLWMLQLGALIIGTDADLIVASRWVMPKKIMGEGFKFLHPNIDLAIENLL
ncbi:MAG: hypothetical protein RIQ33_1194 [Bacteroidota bacterium]|jgi:uncharacterized protein (TIGR01777 family)